MGNFRTFPLCPLTTPAPPDDLGPNGALKTPTTASTRHRRGLLMLLNHAPPIAALRGEGLSRRTMRRRKEKAHVSAAR